LQDASDIKLPPGGDACGGKGKNMKLVFFDIDGTLTDGKIYIGEHGEIMKAFSVKDGYAIKCTLPEHGIVPVIITGRASDIVIQRAKELGVTEIHQGCEHKLQKMLEICEKYGLKRDASGIVRETAYFGDDIPDLECMRAVQVVGCPPDAVREVIEISDYVCKAKAGEGAGREFIEWLVSRGPEA